MANKYRSVSPENASGAALLPADVISLHDLHASLRKIHTEEASLQLRLDDLSLSHVVFQDELGRLDICRAQVGVIHNVARSLSQKSILNASASAQEISSSVDRLDVEQERVKQTLAVVEMVSELKACVLGVMGSMGAPQDWEMAAAYLNRASKIPSEVIGSTFAERMVPTAEVPDPPAATIKQAAASLQVLFLKEFESAAADGNGGKITRFFKLFPLIGRPETGLDVYGRYVCQSVASRARANLDAGAMNPEDSDKFVFAAAMTKLFENIAQIIDNHSPIVERHYGSQHMGRVIERLQLEADLQGGIILDTWTDNRNVARKLRDIKSYAFTFLVQSFLPTSQPRLSSARYEDSDRANSTSESALPGDEPVDLKEIDGLTREITVMLNRWSLFTKFIGTKCQVADTSAGPLSVPPVIAESGLRRKIAEKLIDPFSLMIAFILRRSVERAFQLDEQPSNLSLDDKLIDHRSPIITSAVDDVMYVVSQILDKAIQTSQRSVIANIVPTISRVLSADFIGMIQRKLRDEHYPRAAAKGGAPQDATIIAFLILLNDLDVAIDYTRRIVDSHIDHSRDPATNPASGLPQPDHLDSIFPMDRDAAFVRDSLANMETSFSGKASELIGDGIFVVFKNIYRPRVRAILAETFRDIDYDTMQAVSGHHNENQRKDIYQAQNEEIAVPEVFRLGWERLSSPLVQILTERNCQRLLSLLAAYLGEMLEKRIWGHYGRIDHHGAVRLERDIASIINVVVRGGNYRLREYFTRCSQISYIINLEEEEWQTMANQPVHQEQETDWQLDEEERSRARAMLRTGISDNAR